MARSGAPRWTRWRGSAPESAVLEPSKGRRRLETSGRDMGGQRAEPVRGTGTRPSGDTGTRPARTRHLASFAADRARRSTTADRWLASLLGAEPGVALVAVGGYGRRELLPRSDLDVVLLHGGRDDIAGIADRT